MVDAVWPSTRDGTPTRGNRARARASSVGRSVVSSETPPWSSTRVRVRSVVRSFVRSIVRSFVRQREDVLNRIEIEIDPRRDGNRTSIDGSIARDREVGILGRSRDARETNR